MWKVTPFTTNRYNERHHPSDVVRLHIIFEKPNLLTMEETEKKLVILQTSVLRSTTLEGFPAKIYIQVYENGAITIIKRFVTKRDWTGTCTMLLKKYSTYSVWQEEMAFKASSFFKIADHVAKLIPKMKIS